MSTTRTLAVLAALTLLAGAVLVPASAQPDDRPSPEERREQKQQEREAQQEAAEEERQQRRADADERREAARARQAQAHERFRAACDADAGNETDENRTIDCDEARRVHEPGMKARREAHALMGAVRAVENKIGKLEVLELRLNATSDNATDGNASKRLQRIDAMQDRLAERLALLHEKIDRLHAKWAEVREHVAEKRGRGEYGAPDCDAKADAQTQRLDAWYADALAKADAVRDRRLAQDNVTDEQKAEIEAGHQQAIDRIEAAYADRQAEIADRQARCSQEAQDDVSDEAADESA